MDDPKGKPFFERHTPRASFYEYNEGYYFITICTQHKVHYLGEIQGNTFLPTPLGQYVENKLQRLQNQYANIEIPLYVVMPNHLHLMVRITGADTDVGTHQSEQSERGASASAYTRTANDTRGDADVGRTPQRKTVALVRPYTQTKPVDMRLTTFQQHQGLPLMSLFVNLLKGSVSRFAHKKGIPFAWQGRYHDHVIRGVEDMNQIAQYIRCNVERWGQDRYNPTNKNLYPNDWK